MLKRLFRWLPWLLLAGGALYCAFGPSNPGLIGPVQLPADDEFLPEEKVQWWYWTGHLTGTDPDGNQRRFGFETVFFGFDAFLIIRDQLAQAAITDIDGNSFHFEEFVSTGLPKRVDDGFNLSAGPGGKITAVGGNGRDRLHSEVDGYVLDLQVESRAEPVLHYGGGPHPYVFGGYTYYYSREDMYASGTLTVHGVPYQVEGTVWFDRQYGNLFPAIDRGWQWFAIELDDGRRLMLYDFRGTGSEVERYGSLTDADGRTHPLGPHDFQVRILGHWKSPHTGCKYPSGWRVEAAGLTLEVQPQVLDQELRASHGFWAGPEYWEGTNRVSGDATGLAYVELNGYCRGAEGTFKP